jgi:MOSC domain-containing protein YiiM
MSSGKLLAIHIGEKAGGEIRAVDSVRAIAGHGLEGDRNYRADGSGQPDQEVTLIESEAIDGMEREHAISITGAQSRRNLLTRGISLNPLVGREFRVGEVKLRGIELCEPCRHLERLTKPGVLKGLVHRGGLRAQILESGTIRPGDLIEEIPSR